MDLIKRLKNSELFSTLTEIELKRIISASEKLSIEAGECLIRQGNAADCMYILLRGRLIVSVEDKRGVEKNIGEIERDETVGEMGLLSSAPRSATVTALRDSDLLKLDTSAFHRVFADMPDILLKIANIITVRLQRTLKKLDEHGVHASIVLVPANDQVDIEAFVHNLERNLTHQFTFCLLNKKIMEQRLSKKNITLDEYHLAINKIEVENDFVFFQMDYEDKIWREICLEKVDRIVIIAKGETEPNFHPFVEKILCIEGPLAAIKKSLILLNNKKEVSYKGTSAWLAKSNFFRHHHITLDSDAHFQRFLRFITGTAIGLVLGGGGSRIWAQLGIIKYLLEAKVPIDAVGGVSGGGLVLMALLLGEGYQGCENIIQQFFNNVSFREYTFPVLSLMLGRSFTRFIQSAGGDLCFEDLNRLAFVVSANITAGKEVLHSKGLLWKAGRASASVPGIFPPVLIDKQLHVDGGVMNNLPVDHMRHLMEGRGKIIAVDVSSEKLASYENYQYPLIYSRFQAFLHMLGFRSKKVLIPGMLDVFMRGLTASSVRGVQVNAEQADIYLKPPVGHYSILEKKPAHLKTIFEMGYKTAEKSSQVINSLKESI